MRCVDDDMFVSDQGWGIYSDEKGQKFLRESEEAACARKRPYSPDYESKFFVRPDEEK